MIKNNIKMMKNIKILVSAAKIQKKVIKLGKDITGFYKNKVSEEKPLKVIIIQKGAIIFGADLVREINLPLDLRFMRIRSYLGKTKPQHSPELLDKIQSGIKDNHVLVVEDILDTGNTLFFVKNYLSKFKPRSLNFAVLVVKKMKRKVNIPQVKFKGFDIPNKFVIGYGLDYNEIYRNLPYIGLLDL